MCKVEISKLEDYYNTSKITNIVSSELAQCFLKMIDITYSKKYHKHYISIHLEDSCRYNAIKGLLKYWNRWDYSRGSLHLYYIILIKSMFSKAIAYDKLYPKDVGSIPDTLEIGIWDSAFDDIKTNTEVAQELIEANKYSEKKFQASYFQKMKQNPLKMAKRREADRIRYWKNKER